MERQCENCGRWCLPFEPDGPCKRCGKTQFRQLASDAVGQEKKESAEKLAKLHREIEPGISHVIRFLGDPDSERNPVEPIKLLEVNANTIASGVYPIHFGPAPKIEVPFATVIIELTPSEYQSLRANELVLPDGWTKAEELLDSSG